MTLIATPTDNQTINQYFRRKRLSNEAIKRYEEALTELRERLKDGQPVVMYSADISKKFNISTSFMSAVFKLGAVDRKPAGNHQYKYKSLEKLETIKGTEILNFITESINRNNAVEETGPTEPNGILFNAFGPGSVIAVPNPPKEAEMFLIGIVKAGVLTCQISASTRFDDQEQASDYLAGYACEYGEKLVLVKVVEVVEPTRVLQPSTL